MLAWGLKRRENTPRQRTAMRKAPRGAIISMMLGTMVACSSDTGTTDPGTPVKIDWAPCINDLDAPSWFAVQNGAGAWARVVPTSGVFSFTVTAEKIGIARYANGALNVDYQTAAELQTNSPKCNSARRTVTGTLIGYSPLDNINIQADAGSAFVSGTQTAPAPFALSLVTPDPFDVLAVRSRSTKVGSTFQVTPTSVLIRRAQNSASLALLDLNSATESGAPLSKTVTVANAATGENIFVAGSLSTPTTDALISSYSTTLGPVTGNVSAPFYGLAGTRLATSETQVVGVIASQNPTASTTDSRYAAVNFTDVADKTATLGVALGPVSLTGSARPAASYTIQSGYDQLFELDLDQGSGVSSRSIQVVMSRAYLGATATQVTLAVPDLTGLTAFNPNWQLNPGTSAAWTFFAANATLDIYRHNRQTYVGASRSSTFIP